MTTKRTLSRLSFWDDTKLSIYLLKVIKKFFILIDINRHKNVSIFFCKFFTFQFISIYNFYYNLNMLSKAIVASVLFVNNGSAKRPLYSPSENPNVGPWVSNDRPEM